jgi:hypothetical protein
MRLILGIFMLLHGFAHLPGFTVAWRLTDRPEMPYKTTVLGSAVNLGDVGIRIIGVMWLLGAIAFGVSGISLITRQPWWHQLALATAASSLVLTIIGWPDSRIGILVNLIIIAALILAPRAGLLGG